MLSLATVPAALLLAATALTLGAGAPVTSAPVAGHCQGPAVVHFQVQGGIDKSSGLFGQVSVSDPDPADCPFCGGNPTVHVKVLWQIQKYAAQGYVSRLL